MDMGTNEMVAIKKIKNAFNNFLDAKRTLREIKLLRHLDHENICALPPVLFFCKVYIHVDELYRNTINCIWDIFFSRKFII